MSDREAVAWILAFVFLAFAAIAANYTIFYRSMFLARKEYSDSIDQILREAMKSNWRLRKMLGAEQEGKAANE